MVELTSSRLGRPPAAALLVCLLSSLGTGRPAAEALAVQRSDPSSVTQASVAEANMRRNVKSAPTPEYPAQSLAKKVTGVVVVGILVSPQGKPVLVKVLQAPDRFIGDTVTKTVSQWLFHPVSVGPPGKGHPISVESKLTFYFRIDAQGNGIVTAPELASAAPPVQLGRPGIIPTELPASDVQAWIRARQATIIDIRGRDEVKKSPRKGSVNIPADEVEARVSELAAKAVLIDCPSNMIEICRLNGAILAGRGFEVAYVIRNP